MMPTKQPRDIQLLTTLLKRLDPARKIQATSVLALFFGNRTETNITAEEAIDIVEQTEGLKATYAYLDGNSIYVRTADSSFWRAFGLQPQY